MDLQRIKKEIIALIDKSFDLKVADEERYGLLVEAESLILTYIKWHPEEVDAYIVFALTVDIPPLADSLRAIESLRKALIIDPKNYKALLILASIEDVLYGRASSEIFRALNDFKTSDPDIQSMVEITKAKNFLTRGEMDKYLAALKKSISLSQKYTFNFIYLSDYYRALGNSKLEQEYRQIGLSNLKEYKYSAETAINPDCYIHEYITGIYKFAPNEKF